MVAILVGDKEFPVPESGYIGDAIRDAVAYARENGGEAVLLPPGHFTLSPQDYNAMRATPFVKFSGAGS